MGKPHLPGLYVGSGNLACAASTLIAEVSPLSLYDCVHVLVIFTRVVPSNVTTKIIIKIN